MHADLRTERCETCAWWTREPALAAGTRRPEGSKPEIGCCHVGPPTVIDVLPRASNSPHFAISVFPEVHATRFCGLWEDPDGGGDDGERSPIDNVVRLRDAA